MQKKIKTVKTNLKSLILGLEVKDYLNEISLPTELFLKFAPRTKTWIFRNGGRDSLCFSTEDGFEFFSVDEGGQLKKQTYLPESFLRRCETALVESLAQ